MEPFQPPITWGAEARQGFKTEAGFAERVRASFARQQAMATLGCTLESVEPGRVVVSMSHRPDLTQQHGFVHGGVVATGLDAACGYAAFSLMPADSGILTVEFKVNLMAPARGPRFWFEGIVAKPGRTITVVDGNAWQVDAQGRTTRIATMNATMMAIHGRDDVKN